LALFKLDHFRTSCCWRSWKIQY